MMHRQRFALNLGPKIAVAVGGVLLLSTTILATVAITYVANLGAYLELVRQDTFVPYQQVEDINDALERSEVALLSSLERTPQRKEKQAAVYRERRLILAGMTRYNDSLTLGSQPEMRALLYDHGVVSEHVAREQNALELLRSDVPRLNADMDTIMDLSARDQESVARAMYEDRTAAVFQGVIAATSVLMDMQLEESVFASRAGESVLRGTQKSIAFTVVVTLAVALLAIGLLTRHITRPLIALIRGVHAVGHGDLSHVVPVTTHDELGVLGSAFNQMIEDLREERTRSQRYLDTAAVILMALDSEGRITLMNRHACTVLGWTADELLGCYWVETCLPPRYRSALQSRFENLIAGDLSIFENPVVTRAGEERLIEWRNTLLHDDAGIVVGTFSCGSDITARRDAENALAQLALIVRSSTEAIASADLDGRVTSWNLAAERLFGYAPAEIIGQHLSVLYPSGHEESIAFLDAMRAGTCIEQTKQCTRQRKNASVVQVSVTSFPLRDLNDEIIGFSAVMRDMTERAELEAQLLQAQKMEAVGQLAGGVAHDFNNILTVIGAHSMFLMESLKPGSPDHEDATEIQKAGLRAAGLTRQLLAFSRKQILKPTSLSLNAIIEETRKMLNRLLGEDIEIVTELADDLGQVIADASQIDQVLVNLAVNARDAMPSGGRLTISTRNVRIIAGMPAERRVVPAGEYAMLEVRDTGVGMDATTQARLFEPFFTTKELGKGTGLGLSTVYGILKQSGGYIDVQSTVGSGTTFEVYLPLVEEPAAVVAIGPEEPPSSGFETVLVVEDEPAVREIAMRVLRRQGYAVLEASSGAAALTLSSSFHALIHLVVSDAVMPGMGGAEVVRRLRMQRPDLKALYMSGYTDDEVVRRGIVSSAVRFVQKPFEPADLALAVRQALDN